ncbi:MAG TPA: TlpA disulfide reductase family protein [Sphingobium sp.]|nr:TlpA disulfide reductase family protein [Sphingobium sp.]
MRPVIALLPVAALMLALGGCDKQSGEAAQGAGNAVSADEVTSGEVTSDEVPAGPANAAGSDATFSHVIDRSHKGEAMPAHSFLDPAGKPTSLASQAAGKPLIVNLWATWCAPCVAELPALDRFAGTAAGRGVTVIAVSQDSVPAAQVDAFLAERGLANLKRYLDGETALAFAYGTSLPTTVLYDKAGKEVARVIGALEWDGAEGEALLKEIAG